jgi:AraC family transcriptional regulator, regulatory protein of adaptative response / DNA-3-methyladenine glycosylase II
MTAAARGVKSPGVDKFNAVVTTGIYCRPGCQARPLPQNVRTYRTAAAAEGAGYRACLRCRPYRSTVTVDWAEPELVCRAVQLVLAGALDDDNEASLGSRLGVSSRHLRRLFVAHLGATPDQLARSRRVHFARRLLDDTDLSITEIAYASGFGSTRQLNRACREAFRAPPRDLRARRRAGDVLTADGGLALRLPFDGPLDWNLLLGYFAARAIPGVEHVAEGAYRRTVVVDDDPGVLELFPGADHLTLRAHLPHWEGLIHVVERARRIFALDSNPECGARQLASDPAIGPLITARPGLRVPGTWDAFEVGVRAIVGQQVSVATANAVIARVVQAHGRHVDGLDHIGLTHTFPSAGTLADADLDGLALPRARANTLRAFAQAVVNGKVLLDGSLELDELISALTSVPGIGPWTAHYIALRLAERDAFPAGDRGLRRAVAELAGDPTIPLATIAERWRPWRALAATHLWISRTSA